LAALKYINPIVAAIMHVTGSLLVVFNSFRLIRYGEELEPYRPTQISNSAGTDQGGDTTPALPPQTAEMKPETP
jgi:hypothetical protein